MVRRGRSGGQVVTLLIQRGIRRWGRVALAGIGLMLLVSVAPTADAAPGEDTRPTGNPDLTRACGLNVLMVLDESGSIASSHATDDVQRAFKAFTGALSNTGSTMAVTEFSTVAREAVHDYTAVTTDTITSVFDPYIDNRYDPNGRTNWEDAFRVARYFEQPPDARPLLVVFITDGDPTAVVNNSRVTYNPGSSSTSQNEYELKVPLDDNESTSINSESQAAQPAIPNANAVKARPAHVLAVAVGSALNSQSSLNRLIDISGPDVFSGSGTFDISTDDVYRVGDFSELEAALRDAAFQLCAPSLTVRKLVDLTPDPGTDDAQPRSGWDMTADVSVTGGFTWVLPADGSGSSATVATDGAGFSTFQWTTNLPVSSAVTITEASGAPEGLVADPDSTNCNLRTPDAPDDQILPIMTDPLSSESFSVTIPQDAIVTCEFVNRAVAAPAVALEKVTNGFDADTPAEAPQIDAGEPVTWTYTVTNTGNVTLNSVTVVDDQGVTVTCPGTRLTPGEELVCEATGVAQSGPYANVGTVTGTDFEGTTVTATDPSHYVGVAPGIDIEKATNGEDADVRPGPIVLAGQPVSWTYVVTNDGNQDLDDVVVTDDQGVTPAFVSGDTGGDGVLSVGEVWTYEASGTAAAGPYENIGSVSATVVGSAATVGDADPSHYYGGQPGVTIEKATNGEDADLPADAPVVPVGDPVAWTYDVTNTGNLPIIGWTVTDDQLGTIACPRLLILPGATASCASPSALAVDGLYSNVATVSGTALGGFPVSDTDPSHYVGVTPAIDIQKSTNGDDADDAPGPFVPVPGGSVSWTYVVTNGGSETLVDIVVLDDRGVNVTCPQTTLAPGAQMTCTASGTATEPGPYTNFGGVVARGEISNQLVADVDPSNYFGATSGVDIEKSTNGVDADEGPGPFVLVGQPVEWTYRVTNTGNDTLSDITVTDDQGVTVSCPVDSLGPGESTDCTASGVATEGDYVNVGTVTASDPFGEELTDSDPSHHVGGTTGIVVEKSTNGEDADDPTGPVLEVGSTVTWRYEVRAAGSLALTDITVTDDQGVVPAFVGGDSDGDEVLDVGETWVYEATGTVESGQYANVATASGLDELEETVTDTDPSHYLGQEIAPATSTTTTTTTTTTTSSTTTTTTAGSTTTTSGGGTPGSSGGRTPNTGTDTELLVLGALILIVAGAMAALAARWPRLFTEADTEHGGGGPAH